MTWRHLETSTTTAERNLRRADPAKVKYSQWGQPLTSRAQPSVGGTVEVSHDAWRHSCGALAVTRAGDGPPGKCGKCGGK